MRSNSTKHFGFTKSGNWWWPVEIVSAFLLVSSVNCSFIPVGAAQPSFESNHPFAKGKPGKTTPERAKQTSSPQFNSVKFLPPPGLDPPEAPRDISLSSCDQSIAMYLPNISSLDTENKIKEEKEDLLKENKFLKRENLRLLEEISRLKRSNSYLSKEVEYKEAIINSISNLENSFEEIFAQIRQQVGYFQEAFIRLRGLKFEMNKLLKNPSFRYGFLEARQLSQLI